MMNIAKRSTSLLLALVLCIGMFAGVQFPEAQAASYTYNWGARGTVADEDDFTRSTAEEWMSKQNTSYEELSALAGASSTSATPSSALYLELKDLMTSAHTTKTSYDGTKSMYQYTDCQNGGGTISSFYSGKSIGPAWGQGDWNREHTWPKSKSLNGNSNGGQDETDIMMLRPTATSENSSRGNTAYGENYYDPNDESGGKYNLHGDVARICLYVYVRWGNTQYMWGSSGVMESKDVLLKWMKEDPVDTWELARNDSVQSITGTRNVFVDYPELGFLLFDEDVPAGYSTPSGSGNAVSYNITATSNNTNYGTVALSGKTITATPKTGYYVQGYTVTSGTATVTQSGNTFRVEASSDCSVRINFAAKTAVKLTFVENGVTAKTVSSYGGDSVTLPSNTNTPAEGYTFVGWTDAQVTDTTTKPAIYTAGTSVTASNKTYYALYTYSVGGTGVTEYALKDITEIKAGDEFVITMTKGSTVYALPNGTITKGPTAQTVTASNGKLTSDPAASLLWNLSGSADAWKFNPSGDTSQYLNCINDNNGVSVGTGTNNTFKISGTYLFNNGTSRYVGVYTDRPDWRCYTSSSTNIGSQTLGFYVKSESGVLYYTTSTYVCEHEDTCAVTQRDATCTTDGYTAGVYCNDCDTFISGGETLPATGHSWGNWTDVIAATCTTAGTQIRECANCDEDQTQTVAATGHSYSAVVTPPTATEQGYTTHTCGNCGDSYVDSYIDAVGESVKVSFSVPTDVTAVADMFCNKEGITLPVAEAPEGYTFLGWTTQAIDETQTKPQVLTGTYTATANTTLYALYSFVDGEGGQADGTFTKHTGVITEGDYVIYYKTDAMVATSTGSERISATGVSVVGNAISDPAATIIWHIAPTADGYYTIYNEANGVYAAGNGSKNKAVLVTSVTDYAKWSVAGDSAYEFTNLGNDNKGVNALLHWNSTSIGWACYSGSTGGAVTLYKGATGTTYYTTLTQTDPVFGLYTGTVENGIYATLEAALADYTAGQYVKLLRDAEAEVILEKDLYLDMNGYSLSGIMETDGHKVYGIDSSTDGYTCENMGYFNCVDIEDVVVIPETMTNTSVTGASRRYLTIGTDDGFTFHRFYLGLTHTTLKPATKGVGYKATFAGDEMVKECIDSYGYSLQLEGHDAIVCAKTGEKFVSGKQLTLRVDNYDTDKFGECGLSAGVYMVINGEVVLGNSYTTTLRGMVEKLNGKTMTETQKTALAAWIAESETMQTWEVDNIID